MKEKYEVKVGSWWRGQKTLFAWTGVEFIPERGFCFINWYSLDCTPEELAALLAPIIADADNEHVPLRVDCYGSKPEKDADVRAVFEKIGFTSYPDSGPFRMQRPIAAS